MSKIQYDRNKKRLFTKCDDCGKEFTLPGQHKCNPTYRQLEATNKKLKEFIEKYPSHDIQCAVFSDVAVKCDCGYWQAKEQALKGGD